MISFKFLSYCARVNILQLFFICHTPEYNNECLQGSMASLPFFVHSCIPVQVDADPDTYIPGGSLIGWTPETSINPICFDFRKDYDLYFRSVPILATGVKNFPKVGEQHKFQVLPYPAIFSIAVEIDTSKLKIIVLSPLPKMLVTARYHINTHVKF